MAVLEAQIEQLKEAIMLLQGQVAEMRRERDKWQSRAERTSIVAATGGVVVHPVAQVRDDHFLAARRERVLVSTDQLIHISYNQLMNFPSV